MAVTIDKARGCLLGQAIGDALGAPLQGLSRQHILRTLGPVRDYIGAQHSTPALRNRRSLPGLYSGETQQQPCRQPEGEAGSGAAARMRPAFSSSLKRWKRRKCSSVKTSG